MQNTYERLAFSIRTARKRENITQAELAERLKMSIRTIQGIENCKGNPKFETIILLCRELNISLDAALYPDIPAENISKSAIDFFKNKSESETQKYIDICRCAEKLTYK